MVTLDEMDRCPTCGGQLVSLDGADLAEQRAEMEALLEGAGRVTEIWRCTRPPCLELFWGVEPIDDGIPSWLTNDKGWNWERSRQNRHRDVN